MLMHLVELAPILPSTGLDGAPPLAASVAPAARLTSELTEPIRRRQTPTFWFECDQIPLSEGHFESHCVADRMREGTMGAALRRLLPISVVLGLTSFLGCRQPTVSASSISVPAISTRYSAVFLTNQQVFFGKLENLGSAYPLLTDVYYVQTQVNPETNETKNTLIKRGNEWHGPDRMVLNAQHILFIEPVTQGSTVAKLIDELKKQH
jgi:hypothetical protein